MKRIEIVEGDITDLSVEAIVNAANEAMLGGGGVDGAIHQAAGPELLDACRACPEVAPGVRCPTGASRITPGFRLPAKLVIHTVGPVWHGDQRGESLQLAACYRGSLELARQHGVTSIAFPAISCGVYGYPPDLAAVVAVEAIADFLRGDRSLTRLLLVAFGSEVRHALEAALTAKA